MQFSSFAQSKKTTRNTRETVIINRNNSGNTTIEITDDGIYLNGERVATRSELNNKNLSKKIIIRDNDNTRSYEEYYNSRGAENTPERRAVLGVFTDGRSKEDGAYINRVTPNSAAAKAGLREGDVIIKIDTNEIYNAGDLVRIIRMYRAGDRVTISYTRNDREHQTTAILGEARDDAWSGIYEHSIPEFPPLPEAFPFGFDDKRPRLGITVEETERGVRIRDVKEGSPAENADLRKGDMITYFNDNRIDDINELERRIKNIRAGSKIKIEINRNGNRMTKMLALPSIRFMDLPKAII